MLIVCFIRNKLYKMKCWIIILLMILLTIIGVLGTAIMFFVETGTWGGTSFFGSLFFIPIVYFAIAKIMSVPYGKMMDYCSAPICAMLVVMKVRCITTGCCSGKLIMLTVDGEFYFPSQIVEAIVMLIILFALMFMERLGNYENKIYSLLLILYGSTRFILNFFRADLSPFVWKLPPGHFWSLIAIALGIISIIVINKRDFSPKEHINLD